jgi:DNA-binding transcriptional ArsR family regulator
MPARVKRTKLSESDRLDLIFRALGDRTRRGLLAKLTQGPALVTELARPFAMSLQAVSRHISVLEQARLVTREVDGKFHRCSLESAALQEAERWLSDYRCFWQDTLESLTRYVEGGSKKNNSGRGRRDATR